MYALLICINNGISFPWDISEIAKQSMIKTLLDKGLLKFENGAYILKGKALLLINEDPKETVSIKSCDSWIDDWINLWPKGVKSGGRPVRGNKTSIVEKMNRLLKNSNWKQEDIIDVTRLYIKQKEASQWQFITCADYFIIKNGSSLLEALLEEFDRDEFSNSQAGNSAFYKLI